LDTYLKITLRKTNQKIDKACHLKENSDKTDHQIARLTGLPLSIVENLEVFG